MAFLSNSPPWGGDSNVQIASVRFVTLGYVIIVDGEARAWSSCFHWPGHSHKDPTLLQRRLVNVVFSCAQEEENEVQFSKYVRFSSVF